jgi:hypothetical protein
MSKPNETTNIAAVPNDGQTEVAVKENLAKRGWNFVKSHKKAAFAVAGLGALVAVSAMLGGSSKNDDLVMTDEEEQQFLSELENADTVAN